MPKQALPQYHVGIDLGTTHCVVAYAEDASNPDIQLFKVNQLIAPGQVAEKPLLPSVRYHPAENELADGDLIFSQPGSHAVIGEAARVLGAKSKGRLVTSAKSWLSHPSVDHFAAVLPWGGSEDVEKVSPVDASSSYLKHIHTVWNQQFPEAPLAAQDIVITVPASFDEGARSLTLEAAHRAGLRHAKLLEEPQAVCYDWLRRHLGNIDQALANIRLLLVCDIGGGTTDLTLIQVERGRPEPKLTRIAVGDHIMLGGDNIDLALAHLAENRLTDGQSRLSVGDLSQLIEQCRIAKERLLAEDAPEQMTITLLGGGSKLIGGSRSTVLTQEEVQHIVLDGFFPLTALDELPDKKRSGMVEFGLPYTAEPAVGKHIAAFLHQHQESATNALQAKGVVPDALLLNGGLFRSQAITQRILDLCHSWKAQPLALLENNYPEYSVAYGAVSYALARRDHKLKIGGGSARSYFLLVDTASTGILSPSKHGICILPKGSEEGVEMILHDRLFVLRTGLPVRFDLVSYAGDSNAIAGDIIEISDEYHALPPLVTALVDETNQSKQETVVQLGITQTELGTLKIQCIAVDDNPSSKLSEARNKRWDVEFQIRTQAIVKANIDAALPPQLSQALEQIQAVFGPKSKQVDPNAVKNLRANLEKQLGRDRSDWDSALLRALFMALWDGQQYRRRSEHHERVWLSLTGFCLRPGFGCPLDDWRVEQLCKLYPQGIQFVNENQNWSEWWTLWRRVAGGLESAFQEKIYADIASYLNPASLRQANIAKQAKQRSAEDMMRLAAVLERLPTQRKIQLGEWLLKRLAKANDPQAWWALGRVGARVPFYGSPHNVIALDIASQWLQTMLDQDWKKNPQAAFAATLVSRNCGDRARDIDEPLRKAVVEKLKSSKNPQAWLAMVEHCIELAEKEESQFFGETLPPGLKLIPK